MSYTEIYAAFENGNLDGYGEATNSWRGGFWVWNELSRKDFDMYAAMQHGTEELFGLLTNERPTKAEKLVLATTADNTLVRGEDIEEVASALEQFEPGTENLKKQAELLRKAKKEGARAVAWNQTSVNGGVWRMPDKENEEEDRCFNIDRDFNPELHQYIQT